MWTARSILAAATLIALLLVGVGILSPNGLPKTKQLQAEAQKLEKQVKKQEQQNQALKEEIELLNSDAKEAQRFQEHVIRQELGFIKDDEMVLLLPPAETPPSTKQVQENNKAFTNKSEPK